jgi:pimeloyl-ACP methyl ester carboxylesterase
LSSQRNVFQTPVWGYGYQYDDPTHGPQDNSEFYRRLQTEVPQHWRELPAVAHIGAFDPLGKESVLAQWIEAIPGLEVHRYAEVGHFVAEAKGPEIAASIVNLLAA